VESGTANRGARDTRRAPHDPTRAQAARRRRVAGISERRQVDVHLARVARAPEIADYPFTTLSPNLGVVRLSDDRTFVIADIPGLIEGAAEGAGLGHQFLRHVERCRVLLHIVEGTFMTGPERSPVADYQVINAELLRYAPDLADKPQIVVLNKSDATEPDAIAEHRRAFADLGVELLTMSAASGDGIAQVLEALWVHVRP